MKILLVNPKWTLYPGTNKRLGGPPSTVATVASALRDYADVEIFDFMASDEISIEDGKEVCGKSYSDFVQQLLVGGYSAVGVTSTWTVQHTNAMKVAEISKQVDGSLVTFSGGHAITVGGDKSYFDLSIIGEIEGIQKDIIHSIDNNECGEIVENKVSNLDKISLPAYDLLDLDFYRKANRNHHGSLLLGGIPIITSRGCPHNCSFCTVNLSMGRKWRANSPEYVLKHLFALQELGFTNIHFEDDNLFLDKNRFIDIMLLMERAGRFNWDTPNGVRLDSLDDKTIELAARSGCKELRVSIETSSDDIRKALGKNLNIGNIFDVARKCFECGIRLCSFYVIGIPGETIENMKDTLRLASKLEKEYFVVPRYSIATPFPGTELLKQCQDNGWLDREYTDKSLSESTQKRGLIHTPEFSPEDINEVYRMWKNDEL